MLVAYYSILLKWLPYQTGSNVLHMYRILLWNQNLNFLQVKLKVVLWTDVNCNITKALVAECFTESLIEILCQVLLAEINIAPMPCLYSTKQCCADKPFEFLLVELVHKFKTILPLHDGNLPTCGEKGAQRSNTVSGWYCCGKGAGIKHPETYSLQIFEWAYAEPMRCKGR